MTNCSSDESRTSEIESVIRFNDFEGVNFPKLESFVLKSEKDWESYNISMGYGQKMQKNLDLWNGSELKGHYKGLYDYWYGSPTGLNSNTLTASTASGLTYGLLANSTIDLKDIENCYQELEDKFSASGTSTRLPARYGGCYTYHGIEDSDPQIATNGTGLGQLFNDINLKVSFTNNKQQEDLGGTDGLQYRNRTFEDFAYFDGNQNLVLQMDFTELQTNSVKQYSCLLSHVESGSESWIANKITNQWWIE